MESEDIVGYIYVDRWLNRRELYYNIDKLAHPDWKMIDTENGAVSGVRGSYNIGAGNVLQSTSEYTSKPFQIHQLFPTVRFY